MVRYTKQSSNQIPQQKSDTPATSLMSIRTRSRPPSNPTTHPRQQTIPGPEWPPVASCPNCCSVVSAAPGASQEGGRRWSTKKERCSDQSRALSVPTVLRSCLTKRLKRNIKNIGFPFRINMSEA